jgi:hypothetical protein
MKRGTKSDSIRIHSPQARRPERDASSNFDNLRGVSATPTALKINILRIMHLATQESPDASKLMKNEKRENEKQEYELVYLPGFS